MEKKLGRQGGSRGDDFGLNNNRIQMCSIKSVFVILITLRKSFVCLLVVNLLIMASSIVMWLRK